MTDPAHAVGIVIQDRRELTTQCLMSLVYSQQPKNSYDLFLIDNGSDAETSQQLKDFVNAGLLPVKNLLILNSEVSIPKAWNLFLALSSDYTFRTKFDNDLILKDTMPTPPKKVNPMAAQPEDAMSGAPRSASIVKGGWNSRLAAIKRQKVTKQDTRFLDHIVSFSKRANSHITALAPIGPDHLFINMLNELCVRRYKGRPFLLGGCMTINKTAFDMLGYFDERLPRKIDIEYTQRAIRNKLNIGYHPQYYVRHMGLQSHTDAQTYEQKMQESQRVMDQDPIIETRALSVWCAVQKKILAACRRTTVVNLD